MGECFGVNLLRQRQTVPAGFREADHFLQPGRAGGFEVQSGVESSEGLADRFINREFVAARMHAQLEIAGHSVSVDCMRDHGDVDFELTGELANVTGVIDTLVEAAGELRRNGLDGDTFIGNGREDHQQLRRSLG